MINSINGHIKISSIKLFPGMALRDCLKILTENPNISDMETGWKWLHLRNCRVDDKIFYISLGFLNDHLTMLSICFDTSETLEWEAWNKSLELKKLEIYKNWLTGEIGNKRNFNWGKYWRAITKNRGLVL